MKKSLRMGLSVGLALIGMGLTSLPVNADVLTFEDLPGDTSALQNGYGGFNWNSGATVGSVTKNYSVDSGYYYGTVGNVSVYNWWGASPTSIDWAGAGTFTFNGAQFTSAWSQQTVKFFGYNDGTLIDTSSIYTLSTTVPLWIELDWSGIDRLMIVNSNLQWDMDNFTFNAGTAVPEPASLFLFGAGLAGLAGFVRKR